MSVLTPGGNDKTSNKSVYKSRRTETTRAMMSKKRPRLLDLPTEKDTAVKLAPKSERKDPTSNPKRRRVKIVRKIVHDSGSKMEQKAKSGDIPTDQNQYSEKVENLPVPLPQAQYPSEGKSEKPDKYYPNPYFRNETPSGPHRGKNEALKTGLAPKSFFSVSFL